jgi:hypothetical protein
MNRKGTLLICVAAFISSLIPAIPQSSSLIGKEVAIPEHLRDGQVYELPVSRLVQFGEKLFSAKWTIQEGAGRPEIKGRANGPRLSDPPQELVFPRNFNRISGPDANSCKGCHNDPVVGGGGGGDRGLSYADVSPHISRHRADYIINEKPAHGWILSRGCARFCFVAESHLAFVFPA